MDTKSLEAAFRLKSREPDLGVLAERFDFAFRESKDLHAAMAAVNELLARPITYQQLFAALRR
jgi:hypothetical protein